jgi:predicted NBD/HSP70 family sugar kinase
MVALKTGSNFEAEASHARHLRRLNLERLLGVAMDQPGPFTRADLTKVTSLSAPTVGHLASQLLREGLIREIGPGPSQGGRRPLIMEFNAQHGFVVGLVLGSDETQIAVANLRGERLVHRFLTTPAGIGPARLLSRVASWVRSLLKEAGVPRDKLVAVAAGAPGAVDRQRGIVVALTPNLKGWSQVPMSRILERALGAPVVLENDVNLAILGERWRGAARGHETCAFISLGVGIGAGIVVGGELHRGHHFLAGEIGLMCMGPQYVHRDFGTRGCLETLASVKTLLARWRRGKGPLEGDVARLFDAAQDGDRRAQRLLEEVAMLIGIATTNLSLALDPSLVVLGGTLISHGDRLVSDVRRLVSRIIPAPPEIVASTLGKEAPLWGSLLMATTMAREHLRQGLGDARVAS